MTKEIYSMTRVNVIPASYMLDEWVTAGCRESIRPIRNVRSNKYKSVNHNTRWTLNKGHELFCAYHLVFTRRIFLDYQREHWSRGFQGFNWTAEITDLPVPQQKDYTPDKIDYRINLARLCARWRKRKKAYHFKGKPIDTYEDFIKWKTWVKKELNC